MCESTLCDIIHSLRSPCCHNLWPWCWWKQQCFCKLDTEWWKQCWFLSHQHYLKCSQDPI